MIMDGKRAGSVTTTLQALPNGVAGVRMTLEKMVKFAREGRANFAVRRQAENIILDVKQKNYFQEARAIQEWVRDNIRYTRDIRDVETLATPAQTLARRVGDCDDKALLVSAMLESIGAATRFVAVGRMPNDFEHVLVEVNIDGNWVAVETTENVGIGWYPSDMPYRLVYNV